MFCLGYCAVRAPRSQSTPPSAQAQLRGWRLWRHRLKLVARVLPHALLRTSLLVVRETFSRWQGPQMPPTRSMREAQALERVAGVRDQVQGILQLEHQKNRSPACTVTTMFLIDLCILAEGLLVRTDPANERKSP